MGILRGVKPENLEPVLEAAVSGGLGAIEITMNTDDAPGLIRRMNTLSGGRIPVGAGTVLSLGEMHRALEAGASFIVSPTLVPDVCGYCAENGIPVFPGAFTPQEIWNAWKAGATMVKVFPVRFFGPEYIREVKGPLNEVELLACGGISRDTVAEYFKNGASAAAFGGSVFRKEWIDNGEYSRITDEISALAAGIKKRASNT